MDPTNSREQTEFTDRLRIPPPPPRTPPGRTLHLVPIAASEPAAPAGLPVILPLETTGPALTMSPEAPSPAPTGSSPDPVHPSTLRRLERELAEVQDEVGALQEMLEELPAILEHKFRGRLDKLLSQQRLLEADNQGLRRRLQALLPGVDLESQALRPRALLPPSIRTALKLRSPASADAGDLDAANAAGETHLQ